LFLPEECPLVDHIAKSYKKHYIGPKSLLSKAVKPKPPSPEKEISKFSDTIEQSQITQFEVNRT